MNGRCRHIMAMSSSLCPCSGNRVLHCIGVVTLGPG